MRTLELVRLVPGITCWRVLADGTNIGTVSGARGLGGFDFETYGPVGHIPGIGVHSVNPRRYPTARAAAEALTFLIGAP